MSDKTRTISVENGNTVIQLKQYTLQMTSPEQEEGSSYTFSKRVIRIGSDLDCDLSIDDPLISRQHCQIELDIQGYRLRDLGSKNGTFLGNTRINDIYLTAGHSFLLGNTTLTFSITDKPIEIFLSRRDRFDQLIGKSNAMREIFALLERAAPTNATVLLEGESGTGKELAARALHEHSARKEGPFIVFDCSAVPRDLAESALFGHVRGAFTGAISDRQGAFAQASGGTLFLDEVGELCPSIQPILLRALDSGTVCPVGGNQFTECDTRIVAATNRNLTQEVETGGFREDLYYRLAVIQIQLPPLRKRIEDIPILVEHFLDKLGSEVDRRSMQVGFQTMEKLKKYPWSGNVRELKNFVERAAILSDGERVETRFLRLNSQEEKGGPEQEPLFGTLQIPEEMAFKEAKNHLISAFETAYWQRLLKQTSGNVSEAARIAGVHRKSVEYILRKIGMSRSGDYET